LSSKTNSIVEVNGLRYDALSGQLLAPKKIINKGYSSGKKMIDGFVVSAHGAPKSKVASRAASKATALHKRAQHSSTLMRQAVKKPASAAEAKHGSGKTASTHKSHHHLRAKTVAKHAQVNRFGFLPSREAPKDESNPAEVKIAAKATYRAEVTAPRLPSMVTSVSHKKLEEMLDEALVRADAHKHMTNANHKKRSFKRIPRWLGLTVLAVFVLIAVFWLIWQNLPSVAVHVAAARSHVNASVPAYTPDGYKLAGPLNYGEGSVTMRFKAADKSFALTQKASTINSEALQSDLPSTANVQTSMIDGTTVYIYGNHSDATWVNHGVLYNLKNSAGLPTDQVLKIVQSL
jgi:Domain of unknown function (DUF4367)